MSLSRSAPEISKFSVSGWRRVQASGPTYRKLNETLFIYSFFFIIILFEKNSSTGFDFIEAPCRSVSLPSGCLGRLSTQGPTRSFSLPEDAAEEERRRWK